MAREKEDYRANLEILNMRFPDHDMLSVEEVKQVFGYANRKTVIKYFGEQFVNGRMSKAALARCMSK